MHSRVCHLALACALFVLTGTSASSAAQQRILMHTFQDGPSLVFLSYHEAPAGPVALLRHKGSSPRERLIHISQQQFDDAWMRLMASGATQYSGSKNPSRKFDAESNYIFSIAYLPEGTSQNFVVPKNRASDSLRKLSEDLQIFARSQ